MATWNKTHLHLTASLSFPGNKWMSYFILNNTLKGKLGREKNYLGQVAVASPLPSTSPKTKARSKTFLIVGELIYSKWCYLNYKKANVNADKIWRPQLFILCVQFWFSYILTICYVPMARCTNGFKGIWFSGLPNRTSTGVGKGGVPGWLSHWSMRLLISGL